MVTLTVSGVVTGTGLGAVKFVVLNHKVLIFDSESGEVCAFGADGATSGIYGFDLVFVL